MKEKKTAANKHLFEGGFYYLPATVLKVIITYP